MQKATRGDEGSVAGTEGGLQTWRKPGFGELKLNCDAAWRNDTKMRGCWWWNRTRRD